MRLIVMGLQIGDFGQFVPSAQITNLLKCPISIYLCNWKGHKGTTTVGSVGNHLWFVVLFVCRLWFTQNGLTGHLHFLFSLSQPLTRCPLKLLKQR